MKPSKLLYRISRQTNVRAAAAAVLVAVVTNAGDSSALITETATTAVR